MFRKFIRLLLRIIASFFGRSRKAPQRPDKKIVKPKDDYEKTEVKKHELKERFKISRWSQKNNITEKALGCFIVYCEIYKIVNPIEFLAQLCVESSNLTKFSENLNYSERGLRKMFPRHFKENEFKKFARQPERIANRTYANRLGNGDEESGDGFRNRGGGGIQITFANNWQTVWQHIQEGQIGIKQKLEEDGVRFLYQFQDKCRSDVEYAVISACIWWCINGCNDTKWDIVQLSNKVNRGTFKISEKYKPHGLEKRVKIYNEIKATV